MAFKLRTFIRVRAYDQAPARCIEVNEDGSRIVARDVTQRFQAVTFNFPRIFTDESQVRNVPSP